MFIFLNERSFFTFFALLTCLDHILFELLLFGPTRYEISGKIRALEYPLFEMSTDKVYVHDAGLCTARTISQAQLPLLGQTKVAQRGYDPGMLRGRKTCNINVHS